MFHLFRRIRKSLLDNQKFRKYIIYAIGEIVLVMIGILLALQVNNWNSMKKDKNLENEYINRLHSELQSELSHYQHIIGEFKTKSKRLKRIIRVWQSDPIIISDSIQYINDFTYAGHISLWYKEPVTWTQLVQSGNIKIIKDQDLLNELHLYYNSVKKASENYKLHPMEMTNKARETFHSPFKYEDPDHYFESSFKTKFKEIPSDFVFKEIEKSKDEYLQIFLANAYVSQVQCDILSFIIMSGEEVLEKLKVKIES